MPEVVGIRFKKCGKIYDFEVDEIKPALSSLVVIESNFGVTIGNVAIETHNLDNPERELKKILRLATEQDLKQRENNESVRVEARSYCNERVIARALPMKLIDIEVTLDKKRILFYFTANGRIDFRELVKDLASKFKTRIEMRQIGVRDEAKLIGGLGICGRETCCRTFLSDFAPISIKMARNQEIALNPGKLSGLCGRLMCCIGFENSECNTCDKDEDVIIIDDQHPIPEVIEIAKPVTSANTPAQNSGRSSNIRKSIPVQKWKKIPLADFDPEIENIAEEVPSYPIEPIIVSQVEVKTAQGDVTAVAQGEVTAVQGEVKKEMSKSKRKRLRHKRKRA